MTKEYIVLQLGNDVDPQGFPANTFNEAVSLKEEKELMSYDEWAIYTLVDHSDRVESWLLRFRDWLSAKAR